MLKNWPIIKRYIKLVYPYWDKSVLSLIAIGITVFLGMAIPLITKVLIDYAYPNRDLGLLTLMLVLGLFIFFFNIFFSNITSYLDNFIHQRLSIDLKRKFYDQLQKLPMSFLYEKQIGDLMVRISDDVEVVVDVIAEVIPVIIQTFLRMAALLFICLTIDKTLTFIALLGIPIYFVQTHMFAERYADIQQRSQQKDSEIFAFYQEKIGDIKTIKSFNQGIYEANRLVQKLKDMFRLMRENMFLGMINSLMDSGLIQLWTFGIAWFAGFRVITGHMSIGELMAILTYVGQVHQPFMNLGEIYKSLVSSVVSMKRVDEVLQAKPEAYHDLKTFILFKTEGIIRFENVAFKYKDAKQPVLKDISLVAKPGTTTAFVGMSGAGKSTVIDLMQRFIEPTSGTIFLDTYDLKKISLISLRSYISVVSQDSQPFTGSIKENITYGSYGTSKEDYNKINESCRAAEIHNFIMSLPKQYDTFIGEGGLNLSGGQKQRLMIARAIYRNSKILILDEATSALDVVIEHKIYENLKKHTQNKTVLMITHRISTARYADQIIVIKNNLIEERGSFEELVAKKGEFDSFYQLQKRGDKTENAIVKTVSELESMAVFKELEGERSRDYLLSGREKQILDLLYKEKLTFSQISKKLKMSSYQIGRIKKDAVAKAMMLKLLTPK
ncbi:MAG: ATP-binding cassette domain-containing protein [Candidatus Saganbacteria bacterium]|nr:ATP-binding cassette domain-containing protein [Candidatus Saganbacteria bacterium]